MALDANIANQFAALLRQYGSRIDELAATVSAMKLQGGATSPSMPGQYPGKPIPSVEGVEITNISTTARVQGNIVLAADGPFIARAIHFAWRPTAAQAAMLGKWRPVASTSDIANIGLTFGTIDFYWEYSVTGSRRNRQNIPIPSAMLRQAETGNGYWDLPCEDAFSATATITVWVTPTVAPDSAGTMYIGFSGCYILD